MRSGKRILAGILTAMMVLSSAQLPGGVSYAEELPAVQENISEEESAAQEDAAQQESEPVQKDGEETSGDDEEFSGQETEESEEKLPIEENSPEDEAEDEGGETEEDLPAEDVSVSDNDLQVSGNDLMSVGEPEIWADAEIEGAYQFGGAPSADAGIALYAESAYTDEAIMNYLYQQMKARVTPIDVSKYDIPHQTTKPTKIGSLVSGTLNEHPDLYYVSVGFDYSYNPTTAKITQLTITYDTTLNDAVWQQGVDEALATVDENMTDLQKAIVLHDYLTVNCEYDYENLIKGTVPSVSHSTYGVFANRMAVCDGYALSYKYLLKQAGIDCYMVTSNEINHAWNLIKLDGQYYQVDVTWDDPVWDIVGRSAHTYMFRSDANFDPANAKDEDKHSGGRVTYGSQTVDYQATDTRYDNAFWTNCTSPLVLSGNDCYYISPNGGTGGQPALMKTSLSSVTAAGTSLQEIDKWLSLGGGVAWPGAYSGLFRIGNRLYFNDKDNIYSVAMDGTDKKTEFTPNATYGYIYGSAYYRGAVRYSLHDSPNFNEKEQVLKVNIGVGGTDPTPTPESGAALNLDNLFCEYTALDGKKISSAAEGRPKLLIFYRNACANCKSTISNISREIDSFLGVDIYALEADGGTKEEVVDIQKQNGCEEITFSYDTGTTNRNSLWAYIREAGIEDASVAMPVLCYIDANNRLQYITRGLKSAADVRSNLEKYCDFSQAYKITYILRGGTNNSANPSTYTKKDEVIILQDPVREGYQFEGWYRDIAYSVRVTKIYGENKSNIILYAKWKSLTEAEAPAIDLSPAAGNVLMGFSGAYYTETADKILNRLNAIRREACEQGVRNPDTGNPLTMADYVPLQWSSDLEAIARLRAAEATVNQAHDRPNGKSCFTVTTKNGEKSWAENLAWNNSGLMAGIEQWYGEKADWVKQTGKVTGHYTSIISPSNCSVAVSAFRLSSGGWYAVAQEFSYKDGMDAQKDTSAGSCVQYLEVQGKNVTNLAFAANNPAYMQEGETYRLPINVTVQYNDFYNNPKSFTGPYQEGGNWWSSDRTVAEVDSTGEVIALGKGTTQINMSVGTKSTFKVITVYGSNESPIVVKAPNITTYKVGQKINLTGGKVTYPTGNTTQTASLTAKMISGFDSAKPGICTVKVTAGSYMSSFDTLIVEEPKLAVAAGQSLGGIALPQNAYGTYTWKDVTQTVEKAGEYTFEAEFTPNDETKFQKLSDIQVQVTAQETLGNDTDVTFKTNQFTYNGSEQEPKVVVRSSDVVLKEGQDYELSYENNKNAGTATVAVVGTGCYLGSISRTFEIQPAPIRIRAKDKTVLIGTVIPAEGEYEYEISGLVGTDELLTEPSFSCTVTETTTAGLYDIIPSGANAGTNYTISYEKGRLTVASEYFSCTVTFDIQGHGREPAAQTGVKVGDTAEEPADPIADGYRFDGWYQDAACTKAWNFDADIVQADMTLYAKWMRTGADGDFALQEMADVYYTGKVCKPAVSVYDGDVLLKSGRDYQIKYYNNTNANKDGVLKQGNGEGENFNPELPYVEIIGKGDYTDRIKDGNKDTVKVNFNILRASIGDGTEQPAAGVTLKVSEQLVTAKKVQKPFSSIKYVKGMKRDTDFRLHLTVENVRDQSGKSLAKDLELANGEIPAGYEGEFVLAVEGMGNYTGSIRKTIYVTDKAHLMKNAVITLGKNQKNITFSGGEVKLAAAETNSPDTFTVKYGKTFLKPGRDYTVSYRNNDKVGKAELVITGNGEYVGTKTVAFNIKGKAFSAKTVQVSGIENKVYTGRALTQNNAVLTYSTKDEAEKPLQYGTDYTITYTKNINKGSATMTFKGMEKAGYSGSFKKTFKITAADIADPAKVVRANTMENMSFSYCKAGVKPLDEIRLTNGEGIVLQNGKDYTLRYANNKAVADTSAAKPPTVTVQGKGNYTGKFDVTFKITKSGLKQAIEDGSIQIKTTATAYNEKKAETYEYKPAVKLMDGKTALRANTDYEIQYRCNTQAEYLQYLEAYEQAENGDEDSDEKLQELRPGAVIMAKAESNYEADGEIFIPLPIYQTKFTGKNLEISVAEMVYVGSQVMSDQQPRVTVTVKDENGTVLIPERDYEISYGANNKSGKNRGTVTITGIAPKYGGSVTKKFDIGRKPITH